MNSTRTEIYALDLRDEASSIADYIDWHRPGRVPAAVLASIRASGVISANIYQCGNRLVMVLVVAQDADRAAAALANRENAEVQAWEARMDGYQQRLPFANEMQKWVLMEPIFALSEHEGGS
jgi:L-rhamnose mutarotase